MTDLLANHLARALEPGSNLKGAPVPPTWLFLLPQPTLRTVVTIGDVPDDLEARLGGLVDRVARAGEGGAGRPTDVDAIVAGPGAGSADIQHLVEALPDAAVVLLPGAPRTGEATDLRVLAPGAPRLGPAAAAGRRPAWAVPPAAAQGTRVVRVASRALRLLGAATADGGGADARALAPGDGPVPTGAVTVLLPPSVDDHGAPRYVRELDGFPSGGGWEMIPARGYATQKLVFVSRSDGEGIVKVARTAAAAARLRDEADVLEHLNETYRLPDGTAPTVGGRAWHGPVLAVAESRVAGRSLRRVFLPTPTSPLLTAALDRLHALGAVTADRSPAPLRPALLELVAGLGAVYGESPVTDQLREDAEQVARSGIPRVVLHGDAGPQNVLVDTGARIGLVDWENGEPAAPPLWDVLYLLLASVELSLDRGGRRVTARRVTRTLWGRGPWQVRLQREVARASADVGFSVELADPLTRLFLAYLARRDVGRLAAGAVRDGTRYGVLVEAVRRHG